ncbi:MAG: ATP-dependent zinc protease [Rickettsiaceae bacterium]|nr:ATP-dependent zinc protease [Rickettsiaceae bacterium]
MTKNSTNSSFLVGWREWASLPELNIPFIKVKIDTGAKTSSLHAFNIEVTEQDNIKYVSFSIHPLRNNDTIARRNIAKVIGIKKVKSSNGHVEERYTINTLIRINHKIWCIDATLTNRDIMRHRMLLGREALEAILVDPSKSFCQGKIKRREVLKAYETIF